MEIKDLTTLGGIAVALVSLITGFVLQRDTRKMRDLEKDNKKYKSDLKTALTAILGYHVTELENAQKEGKSVELYRKEIRKNKKEYFNTSFLTPGNIEQLLKDLDKN